MRFSQLFTKTLREAPSDDVSVNAQLLTRGGFIYKNSAGIYSYLPLGWRVMQKIMGIIREEMNALGGQELLLPALVEKRYLDATGRWNVDVGFEAKGKKDKEAAFVLGWTHEEILTSIVSHYVSSYKDLPFSAYQIQAKFRNEPRAKSGLLRSREFIMKDLYSFHASEEDLMKYYEQVKASYHRIFERCGLQTVYTLAAGGDFTLSNTHEFQVIAPVGEDTIYLCSSCAYAENSEVSTLKEGGKCTQCGGEVRKESSIEVGNIFPLGIKYAEAFNLHFADAKGERHPVIMGSYGIGLGRVMATIVEIHNDATGILWPKEVAPFSLHMIALDEKKVADKLYHDLVQAGIDVLYDDREGKSAGERFADADLIGIPSRIVVSKKTIEKDSVEVKNRNSKETTLVSISNVQQAI